MHSFRLYLINAIYILTFPYRFVNIYFCVFSDFFRFWSFFIDKSSKALNPPAQNGLPKTELRPPAKPRADSRSAFPQNRAARRAGGQTRGKASRRQTGVPHPCGVLSARSMPLRCGQRLSENRPYTRRTAAPHGASNRHAKKTAQLNAEVIWGNARAYAACPFGIP